VSEVWGSMLLKSCFEEKKFDKAFVFGCEILVFGFLEQENEFLYFRTSKFELVSFGC
jgi:hypothetical protein